MSVAIVFLLIASGMAQFDTSGEAQLDVIERDWSTLIKPVPLDDQIRHWFWRLDPRPAAAFHKFTTERLPDSFSEESRTWCEQFFRDPANPYKCGLRRASHYSLAPYPGRQSLLRYEWANADYRFALQEGSVGLLLQIRQEKPAESRAWQGRWTRAMIENLLRQVLKEEITSHQDWLRSLRLPDHGKTGDRFSNSKEIYPDGAHWPPDILVILGKDVFWLMVLKGVPGAQVPQGFPHEEWWIPGYLHEADGKVLVIERLWGRAYLGNERILRPGCVGQ